MRELVRCYSQFKGGLKKPRHKAGNASAEMNLQTGTKLVSVQRADINCVSTR